MSIYHQANHIEAELLLNANWDSYILTCELF